MLFGKAKLPMDLGTFDLPKGGMNMAQTIQNTTRTNSMRNANLDIKHNMSNKPIKIQTHRAKPNSKLSLENRKEKALSPGPTKPQFISVK